MTKIICDFCKQTIAPQDVNKMKLPTIGEASGYVIMNDFELCYGCMKDIAKHIQKESLRNE